MEPIKAGQGDERKEATINLTNNYIDKLLEDYGEQLLPPPKKCEG